MSKFNLRTIFYRVTPFFLLIITIIILLNNRDNKVSLAPAEGSNEISFHLKSIQGNWIDSEHLKGQKVMLTFINISNDWDSEVSKQSRAQLNFVKSMEEQFGQSGTRFILVVADHLLTNKDTSRETLMNFSYDINTDLPIILDNKKLNLAGQYNVTQLPSTVLIDPSGKVTQKWDGLVLSNQLSSALRQDDLLNKTNPAQSIFRGLDAARQLTPNLWLIDGGNDWNSEFPRPFAILVVGIKGDFQVEVYTEDMDSNKPIELYHGPMDKIPEDEAKEILANMPSMKPFAHMLTIKHARLEAGRYKLKVIAKEKKNKKDLLSGEVVLDVK